MTRGPESAVDVVSKANGIHIYNNATLVQDKLARMMRNSLLIGYMPSSRHCERIPPDSSHTKYVPVEDQSLYLILLLVDKHVDGPR